MSDASTASQAKRSVVWALPIAAGGCGACAQSVLALQAPQYAAELNARGISFATSPRHADVVLITGPVTTASLAALQAYVDGVPQPRALIAVGDCAVDGGVFRGSPDLVPSLAEALDVHVEISGCPPAPSSVLAAIAQAAQLLAGADAADGELDDEEGDDEDDEDVEVGEVEDADALDDELAADAEDGEEHKA
jgi:Ni,Fe-hydrogenase III small subunit